jgi:hypothetical protein
MRYFDLLNFQYVVLFLFPTLVFIILLGVGLRHAHFQTKNSEERKRKILHVFPGGIEERDAPFPLVLLMIIAGFILWAIFYTLGTGLLGIRI